MTSWLPFPHVMGNEIQASQQFHWNMRSSQKKLHLPSVNDLASLVSKSWANDRSCLIRVVFFLLKCNSNNVTPW
jgi:maltodextrin utilization protein YvdJ